MLLAQTSIEQLSDFLASAMSEPTWPGLHFRDGKQLLRQRAQELGRWDQLEEQARPRPIEVWPRSLFRQYQQTGVREPYQDILDERMRRTMAAAFALWLGHSVSEINYLQDLLWAYCESTTWVLPAHERFSSQLELGSTLMGRNLAEILYLLQDVLDTEVQSRLAQEIDRRLLDAASDWRRPNSWATTPMNWNHVCNGNLIQVALYRIADPFTLAHFIHPLIQRLDYALNGFAADGGCLEGPGYWEYGFGNYVEAAVALHQRTRGALNLMDDPRIPPICRYPLAVHFDANHRVAVGDTADGYLCANVTATVNHLHPLPELHALTRPRADGQLDVTSWRGLSLPSGPAIRRQLTTRDALLPATGLVRVTAAGDPATQLAMTVGHNGVPHNHNDIGSFLYFKHGRAVLTDPGAPRYTAQTFGPNRYQLVHTRSLGHSVPIINGQEQTAGEEFWGSLQTENLATGEGPEQDPTQPKVLTAEIARAYPIPSLRSLRRTLALTPTGVLAIEDLFEFTQMPESIDEGFVTFESVRVEADGRGVHIGLGQEGIVLRADHSTSGTFSVMDLPASLSEGRDGRLLRRISFKPKTLERRMRLAFTAR